MMMYILQLEGGKNIANARDSRGGTPLHYVMLGGKCSYKMFKVELLL